jgi:hypothetical protein
MAILERQRNANVGRHPVKCLELSLDTFAD